MIEQFGSDWPHGDARISVPAGMTQRDMKMGGSGFGSRRRRVLGAALTGTLAVLPPRVRPVLAAEGGTPLLGPKRGDAGAAGAPVAAPPRSVDVVAAHQAPADYIGYVEVPRYFPETGHNVTGELFTYFYAQGGPDVLGFPITEEFWEPGAEGDGAEPSGSVTQYFQRARLEFDPRTRTTRRSPLGELLIDRQEVAPPDPDALYVPETGHNIRAAFLTHYRSVGGAETLGYPLSEEVWENGHPAQWFQRARLEWWPEHEGPRRVQYGLLGEEHLQRVAGTIPDEALRPARPLAPVREWILPQPLPAHRPPKAPLRVPVLYYHQVPAPAPLRSQIQAFKEAGYTFVPLSRVVAAMRGEASLPQNSLALTFDDGWASQHANAAPVLQAEGIAATFFVITRYLGEIAGYMTWNQVRQLKELGHEVECHTQNHPSLDTLYVEDPGAVQAEVWESLAILERRLGHSQRLFAYPNGRWSAPVAALVARVYRGAVATGGGATQHPDQLFWLSRIKAEPTYSPESLLRQIQGPTPNAG